MTETLATALSRAETATTRFTTERRTGPMQRLNENDDAPRGAA